VPGFTDPFPVPVRLPPLPDDPVSAARLALRLQALASALDDLPGHARRFARWPCRVAAGAQTEIRVAAGAQTEKARAAAGAPNGRIRRSRLRRVWPLRPGRPPGWRGKPDHKVHEILNVTNGLAVWALEAPDTS
jgi:hypothetical protein